jgi:hypothetical protein
LADTDTWGWVFDARGRVALIIAGDLLLMHRTGLAGPKAVYLLVAVLAAVAALPAVREVVRDRSRIADRRMILAAAAIGALAVLSLPVALYHHNSPSNWIRDVSVYGLLAAAPALAIDLRRSAGIRWVSWALIASGTLAAISFAAYWATVRGYASLPGERALLLPSWYLGAALFAYASARAIGTVGRERTIWALVSLAVLFSTVGTGTRSSVILLAAPIVQFALTRHRKGLAIVGCALVLVAGGLALAENRGLDLGGVGNRLTLAATFVRHPTRDQSWKQRVSETRNSLDAWRDSPAIGVGAGHVFEWTYEGIPSSGFIIDTPTGFLAKFGVLGVLVLLGFFAAAALVVRERWRSGHLQVALPFVGLGAVTLCGFPFGMPLEDKGFPVAFLLTYALTLPGAADPPLRAAELRRRAWALAAVVGVACVVAAPIGGRIDTGPKPSILGPDSPPVRVIASYEQALWAGDGTRACALLTPSMRAHYWGSLGRCRAVLSELTPGGTAFAHSRASVPAVVRSNPRTLQVVVTRRDGKASLYRVVRRPDGRWVIADSRQVRKPSTATR